MKSITKISIAMSVLLAFQVSTVFALDNTTVPPTSADNTLLSPAVMQEAKKNWDNMSDEQKKSVTTEAEKKWSAFTPEEKLAIMKEMRAQKKKFCKAKHEKMEDAK